MVLLADLPTRLQAQDPEERQSVSGVSWGDYETLLAELGDNAGYRVTYLDGVLELMIVTSGSVSKLTVYQRLGVREVWFFQNGQFEVYCLRKAGYEAMTASDVLPDLDLGILAQYVNASDPLEAALAFRESLQLG